MPDDPLDRDNVAAAEARVELARIEYDEARDRQGEAWRAGAGPDELAAHREATAAARRERDAAVRALGAARVSAQLEPARRRLAAVVAVGVEAGIERAWSRVLAGARGGEES